MSIRRRRARRLRKKRDRRILIYGSIFLMILILSVVVAIIFAVLPLLWLNMVIIYVIISFVGRFIKRKYGINF